MRIKAMRRCMNRSKFSELLVELQKLESNLLCEPPDYYSTCQSILAQCLLESGTDLYKAQILAHISSATETILSLDESLGNDSTHWPLLAWELNRRTLLAWEKGVSLAREGKQAIPVVFGVLLKMVRETALKVSGKHGDPLNEIASGLIGKILAMRPPSFCVWSEDLAVWFDSCSGALTELGDFADVLSDARRARVELEKLRNSLDELRSVVCWLAPLKLSNVAEIALPPNRELKGDSTLGFARQLEEELASAIPMSKEYLEVAKFFVGQKRSALFVAAFKYETIVPQSPDDDEIMANQDSEECQPVLDKLAAKCKNFLVELFEKAESLPLKNFRRLYNLTKNYQLDLLVELEFIAEYHKEEVSPQRVKAIQRKLASATEFFALLDNYDKLLEFFEVYDRERALFPGTAIGLKQLGSKLRAEEADGMDFSDNSMHTALWSKHQLLGRHFRHFHYGLFQALAQHAKPFVEFVDPRRSNWDERIGFLTATQQGNDAGTKLLDAVVAVEKLCSIALGTNGSETPPPNSFKEMMLSLSDLNIKSELDVWREIERIKMVEVQLPEIKAMFSTGNGLNLSTVMSYSKTLVNTGLYQSQLRARGGSLRFFYSLNGQTYRNNVSDMTEYSAANLEEIVLQIRVFVRQDHIPEEDARLIKTFLSFHDLAQSVHELRLTLETEGHPTYAIADDDDADMVEDSSIAYLSIKNGIASLQELQSALSAELEQWRHICARRQGRLLLLTHHQFAAVLGTCRFAVTGQKGPEWLFRNLSPYLSLMFPNALVTSEVADKLAVDVSAAERSWGEWSAVAHKVVDGASLSFALDDVEDGAAESSRAGPLLVDAVGFDPTQLLCLLTEIAGHVHPPPAALLWCTKTTGLPELKNMIARAESCQAAVGDTPFILVGVNRLHGDSQLELSRLLLPHAEKDNTNERASRARRLVLVFTEQGGLPVFSFLPKMQHLDPADFAQDRIPARLANLRTLGTRIAVQGLTIVQSPPCSGKSTYMRAMNGKLGRRRNVWISVNEDWESLDFIEKVDTAHIDDSATSRNGVFLAFRVSAYANLEEFQRFLFQFLHFGLVEHKSLVRDFAKAERQWDIFVEIHPAPASERAQGFPVSVEEVLRRLPTLSVCRTAQPYSQSSPSYCASPDARLVATVLQRSTATRFMDWGDVFNTIAVPAALTDADVVRILDTSMLQSATSKIGDGVGSMLLRREIFVQVLARKFDWLKQFARFSPTEHALDHNLCTDWIRLFVMEAAAAASPQPLVSAKNAVFSVCSTQNGLPSITFADFTDNLDKDFRLVHFMTRRDVSNSPQLLRSIVASCVHVHDSSSVLKVVEKSKYLLTPDLAVKLMFIHSRYLARQSVVISGETGTGKTELLEFYSSLLRGTVPDTSLSLKDFLFANVLTQADPRRDRLNRCVGTADQSKTIVEIAETCCHAPAAVRAAAAGVPAQPERDPPVEGVIRAKFIAHVRSVLSHNKLLDVRDDKHLQSIVGGSDDIDDLSTVDLMKKFVELRPAKVFYVLNMHAGISVSAFTDKVMEVADVALYFRESTIVLFIDEFNTTSIMGVVKETICDRSLNGKPLPSNLFVIVAMNPLSYADKSTNIDHTGVDAAPELMEETRTKVREYVVRDPPESVHARTIHFGAFDDQRERDFVQAALNNPSSLCEASSDQRKLFRDLILAGQNAIRAERMNRVKVSIRDVMRAISFCRFFGTPTGLRILSLSLEAYKYEVPDGVGKSQSAGGFSDAPILFVGACILSVGLAYAFRLQPGKRRRDFLATVDKLVSSRKFGDCRSESVLEAAEKALFAEARLPPSIAPTTAFLENFFMGVVCVEAKIPFLSVGPAGTSKTLSVSMLSQVLQGSRSPSPFFRQFHRLHTFRYQCSTSSTDKQVMAIYQTAIEREKTLLAFSKDDRCVVLLDEAGLPSEVEMPLKVLHFLTEKPEVGTLILSNNVLDAAKTNRCALIQVERTNSQDVETLVSAIMAQNAPEMTDNSRVVKALCECVAIIPKFSPTAKKNLHQQRDLIKFLQRMRKVASEKNAWNFDSDCILNALRRNYNGLDQAAFCNMARRLFKILAAADSRVIMPPSLASGNVIEPLLEALNESIGPTDDPNTVSFRHILILDPTANSTAVTILQKIASRSTRQMRVISVGDFPDDHADTNHSEAVIAMKRSMIDGDAVILVNSEPIRSNFYDAFNFHMTKTVGDDNKVEFFVNVAVGSLSRPCVVSPSFKCVVVVPMSTLATVPLPFLDRFEKYQLSVSHLTEMYVQEKGVAPALLRLFEAVSACVKDFVEHVHVQVSQSRLLFSYDSDTIESYLHSLLQLSQKAGTLVVPGGSSHASLLGTVSNSKTEGLHPFRAANLGILQMARPEEMFVASRILPECYMAMYLAQEHFSVVQLVHKRVREWSSSEDHCTEKICVFTRTWGGIQRVLGLIKDIIEKAGAKPEFICLAEVRSAAKCRLQVESALAKGGRRVLIAHCDADICTSNQLNFLRFVNAFYHRS
ncbi:hypothetical protein DFJ73DRAFT_39174 [Zopfochytrium polystomum]|nr:hypothetical protein DFJ73DRAFT_39174 [Zopfochytrium polystomum]